MASALDLHQYGYDSFASSDSDSDEPRSSPKALRDAYHSKVELSSAFPDGHLGGRHHLRRQATDYANVPADHNTLAPYAGRGRIQHDNSKRFSLLQADDREVVGEYYVNGKAVAHIVESKPLPANANYSHAGAQNQRRLEQLTGRWDERPRKTELAGITNGRDHVYGEAEIVEARIAEVAAAEARSTFFNRAHAQGFSDYETSREGYDGYNLAAPHVKRTLPLEHSWRHANKGKDGALRAEAHVATRVDPGQSEPTRSELAGPFHRRPQSHAAIEQIDTANLPLHKVKTNRGQEDAAQDVKSPVGLQEGCRAVGGGDRSDPQPELEARVATQASASVAAAAERAEVLLADNDRQQQSTAPKPTESVGASRMREAVQRAGSDSQACAPRSSPLTCAPPTLAAAVVISAANTQRSGSDSVATKRVAAASPNVMGERDHSQKLGRSMADARSAPAPRDDGAHAAAQRVAGVSTVHGTDVRPVDDARAGTNQDGDRHRPTESAASLPCRAALHDAPLPAAVAPSLGSRIVAIDPARVPHDETATWHFAQSVSDVCSAPAAQKRDANAPHRASQEVECAPKNGAAEQSACRVVPKAPASRALAGKAFGPDRMTETAPKHFSQVGKRAASTVVVNTQRCTPILRMYGAEGGDMRPVGAGSDARVRSETPVRALQADSGYLA